MRPVVIRAGRFWDGVADEPAGHTEILVRGATIAEVDDTVSHTRDADIIDLSGFTVMPGLIDCHVHLTLRPEITGTFWRYSPGYKALLGAGSLGILLRNGFTTVRDCGDMDLHGFTVRDLKSATEQGIIAGPRMIISGHMISSRGGHMSALQSLSPDSGGWENCLADGPDEIRQLVRREIKWGAEWVKYAASGGFSTDGDDPEQVTYTQEEMDVLVGTARDLKRPVAVHVHGDEAIARAVRAGVRSIEHGCMASEKTLQEAERNGTFVVPTQLAAVRSSRLADDDAYWESLHMPPAVRAKIRKYRETILESSRGLAKSSVKIAFGTDLGILPFAINGAREFSEMVTNGIVPVRALRAATSVAADLLMRQDIGVLAPGRCADIIAVKGNPFEDIALMEEVSFVMQAGIVRKQNGIMVNQP